MATPSSADEIFHRSLDRFKISLSSREKEDFALTTLDDVHDTILKIEREHATERKMRNMARLQGFLEGMEQYGSLIEVFLNVSAFVAFVWGPMKFLLQIAKNYIESLDALLDAYEKIGETIPLLAQYDKLFADKPAMQRVLGRMYQDILEFHRRALVIFRRKSWQSLFKSTWKDFDQHFKRLLENLKQHRIDVESQASLIEVERNHAARKTQEEHFAEVESAERKRQATSIIQKIAPANFNQDQESLASCWSKYENFGGWLFREEKVKAWLNPSNLETRILWLKGIPGAGKSVVASRIIVSTKALKQGSVLFFYCKNEDRGKSSLAAILKGLLAQAIYVNDDILPYIYDECSKSSETTLGSVEFLKKLLEHTLDRNSPTWIVLDGLDECERKEKKKTLQWITSLAKSEQQRGHIRLLISSQDEGEIQKQLGKRPFILLNEAPQHKHAIHTYCIKKALKIREKFGVAESKTLEPSESAIVNMVTERAQGMFLFAKLVLKHLKSQVTLTQLRKELDPSIFPSGLYEIYDRIIQRVYSHPLPQRHAAERILSWIACAKRKLFWHEIQAVFSIDVKSETVDFEGRRLRGMDIKDLCGSLVDISLERSIRLVHDTARLYLVDSSRPNMKPRISITETNFDIAITSLHYLSFPAFNLELTDQEISIFLFEGHYAFQDFATAYWSDYLCACTRSENLSSTQIELLAFALDKLAKRHFIQERQATQSPGSSLSNEFNTSRLTSQLQAFRASKSSTKYEIISLNSQLQRRRLIFESLIGGLLSNDTRRFDLTIYYGDPEGWFKCPREQCYAFYEGFSSVDLRDKHFEKHLRQYLCSVSGCIYATLGFTKISELNRHRYSAHPGRLEEVTIEFPQSETFPTLRRNKKAKSSTNNLSPGGFNVQLHQGPDFPTKEGRNSPLPEHEAEKVDEVLPFDTVGNDLRSVSNKNAGVLRLQDILKEDHGTPTSRSSRVLAQGVTPQNRTTESLIEELASFNFGEVRSQSLAGYTSRIGADGWIAISTTKEADPAKSLDVNLKLTFRDKNVVASLSFSTDGKYVAIGGNSMVKIFNTVDGTVLHSLKLEGKDLIKDNYCRDLCFSLSGKILASAWDDGIIRLLEVKTGWPIGRLVGHTELVQQLDMGRDGRTMVSGGGDMTVRVWDIGTHQNKLVMAAIDGVTSVAVSTDTNIVVSGGLSKVIQVWDLKTGSLLKSLSGHKDCIYDVRFLPDYKSIITASLDKTIIRWEIHPLETSKRVARYQGHKDFSLCVASSQDGKWMFSGSKDRSVVCWDIETGAVHHIIKGHGNSIIRIAASPVENIFATASGDMTMKLWKYNLVDNGNTPASGEVISGKESSIHGLLS